MWGKGGYDMMSPVPMRAPAGPAAPPPGTDPARAPGTQPVAPFGNRVELVPPRGLRNSRIMAVIVAVGGIVLGLMAWGALAFIEMMFSIWGSERSNAPIYFGGGIAVLSFAYAAYLWTRVENLSAGITVNADRMIVSLPEWRHPLMVPRSQVRLIAIDDRPLIPFTKNERFPIDGELPGEVFADALDRSGSNPWEPKPSPVPSDPVPAPPMPSLHAAPPPPPDGYQPAESDAGWASVGSRRPAPQAGRFGHLYSGDGSALPLFVYNETDLPNLALVFTGDLPLPHRSMGFSIMGSRRSIRSSKARRARGMMLRARNGAQARGVFDAWGIVRNPHADDVLGAGLRPPKPLMGWRLAAYAAMLLAPFIIRLITKNF